MTQETQPSRHSPHVPLTARYRPQRFSDVAGQETVTAILSRAALEDRVAPAYLFSGTRGVGKTTIARIFAKALNCRNAPAAEPCNECDQCRRITQGGSVDVVEIDGASNRGIDDARRLKESIGYAPMDSRYKVFIIDEAHMLTREAFNALLKTLEEPPARVTFVLATTELHKLPATILSRCQQFTFKRLTEHELAAHLTDILTRESIAFEPGAVRLIAKRGAGSVRDSMSLLGQVLALGEQSLTEAAARDVLGLAGQELFARCLTAIAEQDAPGVAAVVASLLDQGVDMGFFLRELGNLWRNLFMLRQAGDAARSALDLSDEEAAQLAEIAGRFELSHIHACWQMTLEGQRRILTSLEPSQGLELLLLNLALLPRLVSLEQLSRGTAAPAPAPGGGGGGNAPGMPGGTFRGASGGPQGGMRGSQAAPLAGSRAEARAEDAPRPPQPAARNAAPDPVGTPPAEQAPAEQAPVKQALDQASVTQPPAVGGRATAVSAGEAGQVAPADNPPFSLKKEEAVASSPTAMPSLAKNLGEQNPGAQADPAAALGETAPLPPNAAETPMGAQKGLSSAASAAPVVPGAGSPAVQPSTWEELLVRCDGVPESSLPSLLRQMRGELADGELRLFPRFGMQKNQLQLAENMELLTRLSGGWRIVVADPEIVPKTSTEMRAEAEQHPAVVALKAEMNATLVSCVQAELL